MTYDDEKKLSSKKVKSILKTQCLGHDFHFFEKVTSTFEKTKECKVSHGSVVCARSQTNGRGRLGRQWDSDEGGIYFSLILNPGTNAHDFGIYTVICALGVQRALEKYLPCYIKWPNDIVSEDGKKLCGILSKLEFSGNDAGMINVGIGINVNTKSFDPKLSYASSLRLILGDLVDENEVLSSCLYEIEKCVLQNDREKLIKDFSDVCITVGARVRAIFQKGDEITGICKRIENDGSIVIDKDDGTSLNLNSGEVSVRGIYGENYV